MAVLRSEPIATDPVVAVLAAAMDQTDTLIRAEARRFELASDWAALHPGDQVDQTIAWGMRRLALAGEGAPGVEESCVAEFALAAGMTHDQGVDYVGDAIEVRHRLPRLWKRVIAGEVPVGKARRIADSTHNLPPAAADQVDRHIAWIADRCSYAEINRQVDQALAEHDPAETERLRQAEAEKRHLNIYLQRPNPDGQVYVEGLLDLADAIAFDKHLAAKAATLDPQLPLDVRRSMAAGMLGDESEGKQVVIYTHTRPGRGTVDVENTRSVVTPDQVREWCSQAGTRVTVRPVLDLDEELSTDVHDPTPTMREQAQARYPTCVYPTCHRPSRGCDLDHRIPWPQGVTTTSNLFPLCRRHHRLKTTGGWTYDQISANTIEWTSPLGFTHRRHIH